MRELEAESATYLVRLDPNQRFRTEQQLRLLNARLDIAQGKPLEAAGDLRAIIVSTESGPNAQRSVEWMQASHLLAQIHANADQWDLAAAYWNSLSQTRPDDLGVLTLAVDADFQSRNYDEALDRIEAYTGPTPLTDDLLLKKVQAHLAIQSRRIPDERNWAEFETALAAAKSRLGNHWELVFAEMEYLVGRGDDTAIAAEFLRAAESQHAESADFWRAATHGLPAARSAAGSRTSPGTTSRPRVLSPRSCHPEGHMVGEPE